MSDHQLATVDLQGEYIEHLHLLSSEKVGWEKVNLIYELEPAGEMPEIALEQHMLVICQGNCQVSYHLNGNWQQETYTEGDIILFPAGEIFPKVQLDRQVPLIELFFEPTILINTAEEAIKTEKIQLAQQLKLRDPLIEQIGIALKTELATGNSHSKLYVDSMATALAVHLLQRYSSHTQEIRNYPGGLPFYKLKQVKEYIYSHLDQNLSLAQLAAIAQMSPHYFATLFKQSTGFAPHQYLTRCRIEKAKQLLRQKQLSIVEISHEVGFQSRSHFTFLFSLAVSHGFHALAIIGLAILSSPEILHNNHGGNLGYFFLIAMTATSFQTTASWLGHRSWQILHTVGMYYLWLAFIYSFMGRLGESMIIYLPFVSLLVVAIALKLILFFKKPSNINL